MEEQQSESTQEYLLPPMIKCVLKNVYNTSDVEYKNVLITLRKKKGKRKKKECYPRTFLKFMNSYIIPIPKCVLK